jgi:hypothetical protein
MSPTIKLYDALKNAKAHWFRSSIHLYFSILNDTGGVLMAFKQVTNAQLRKGYRDDQSKKANLLIGM